MRRPTFSWDAVKAAVNRKKHGVSFEEAKSVFLDDHARLTYDPDHSEDEDRFILLGVSDRSRLIVVCHCYLSNNLEVRLISARKATKKERQQYEDFLP